MATKGKRGRGGVSVASLAGPRIVDLPPEARRPRQPQVVVARGREPVPSVPTKGAIRFDLTKVTGSGANATAGAPIHTERFGLLRRRIAVLGAREGNAFGEVPRNIREFMQQRYREGKKFWGRILQVQSGKGRPRVVVEMWEA